MVSVHYYQLRGLRGDRVEVKSLALELALDPSRVNMAPPLCSRIDNVVSTVTAQAHRRVLYLEYSFSTRFSQVSLSLYTCTYMHVYMASAAAMSSAAFITFSRRMKSNSSTSSCL